LRAAGAPVRAAVINTVSPSGNAVLGSAPASSSTDSIAALPVMQASDSGVTPKRFAARTFAPPATSRAAVSMSARSAAQWSGVVPSAAATLTLTFRSSNWLMVARSPCLTASSRRGSLT
jgi:hypothetical protein